ncbi:MAG: T9SS type A sorting domain-containing protein [Calditrichaeota bacterium]|nr:T9SS type A sorting domain-containing protein [Calditrichota bacterium]
MRKLLILCVLVAVAMSSMAFAEQLPVRQAGLVLEKQLVMPSSRTGSCQLGEIDPAAGLGSFGWDFQDAYAQYLDPAADGDGGCSAPFYPFHVTSVEIPIVIFGSSVVGESVTFRVGIHCPADAASGNVTEACKGPGAELCGTTYTYLLTQEDYDAPDLPVLSIPLECCVNGPFFVVATFLSYTGDQNVGLAPSVGFDVTVGGPYTERCDAFYFFDLGRGYCWYAGSLDFGCGATCNPGDLFMFVSGDAGYTACEPLTCSPCPRTYPGDDATNPIIIDSPTWSGIVDLCDFCSDYDQTYDANGLDPSQASYTGAGPDAVLSWTSDVDPSCFYITITPLCAQPYPFRIRSWLHDSFGFLGNGTPAFPTFGQAQVYNWSGNGNPDDFGCWIPETYYLYLDTRNCCCPLEVTFNGDNILAVEFSSFDAIAGDGKVTLNWRTNAEQDIDHYIVTRNGAQIAEVAGLGDNASGHNYTFVDNSVENGTQYGYQLTAVDVNGAMTMYGATVYATPQAGSGLVTEYALMQNYPNPFNPTTSIEYSLLAAGEVSLKVYTVDGREVATLVNGVQDAGRHNVEFDASNLASGMYLYKMAVNGFTATQKMVLMK